MNIKEVLNETVKELNNHKIEDSRIIAKALLCYVLNVQKEYLIIHDMEEILKEKYDEYKSYILEIINGTPLQYITHNQEFMRLNFYVDENVLIPQPDTEILVEETLKIVKNNMSVLDLCTGSGAIAVSLKKENNTLDMSASDISNKALEIARKNAKNNNTTIKFINSNMFENINDKFDIIVSNPPYIESEIINTLSKEVQSEPMIALDGGKDGLDFYRIIADNAYKYLKNNGFLLLEIGYNQKESVSELLKENYKNIKCVKDLAENDRVIIANI